jgi:hypothetical protein
MPPLLCDLGVQRLGDKELVVSFEKILKQDVVRRLSGVEGQIVEKKKSNHVGV